MALMHYRWPSSKLEYVLVSVMLLDAIDCSVVEYAIDMGEDSFIVGRRGTQWRIGRREDRRHFFAVAGRRPSGGPTPTFGDSYECRPCIDGRGSIWKVRLEREKAM